jgi:hypothetical protein
MHCNRLGLATGCAVLALSIAACGDSPTMLAESAREGLGVTSGFDSAAKQFLGTSLSHEFHDREFAQDPAFWRLGRERYPLEIGNRWRYRRIIAFESTVTGEEPTLEILRARVFDELIGVEERFGRDYVVLERVYDEGEAGLTTQWVRYRQDRDGLYEADISISEPPVLEGGVTRQQAGFAVSLPSTPALELSSQQSPSLAAARAQLLQKLELLHRLRDGFGNSLAIPAGAAKDALDNELTRLRYPLHPGSSWTIREIPQVTFTVEGMQVLRLRAGLFPAWRLRLNAEFLGPDDRVVFWYGRVGLVGMAAQLEIDLVDLEGNVIGVLSSHEREVLSKVELRRPQRHGGY